MSTTLTNLIDAVNAELENHAMRGSAEDEGDGTTAAFLIAPMSSFIVDDATFAAYISGALTTAYVMDYDSGVITFTAAPALAAPLVFDFNYVAWTRRARDAGHQRRYRQPLPGDVRAVGRDDSE
jgi:hypothetical protein